ncbi:uncharacterized protein LOC108040111 [Drosophila rhopaloa]|uniref:Uncharacterized protein LOC108040111 n=1 Tax=Drosophila rhopaloa TaxID=1041015 RepID=A0A6P4E4M1_DRORH|nr:uncharacterized protein LOC108040111 [Drosophila rhopaloa]
MIKWKNVLQTRSGKNACSYSRMELLQWVNSTLKKNVKCLEDLGNGAEYCMLLHKLRPSCINLKKVTIYKKSRTYGMDNMTLIRNALLDAGVNKKMELDRLAKRGYRENLEFAQWFKAFYDFNEKLMLDEQLRISKENEREEETAEMEPNVAVVAPRNPPPPTVPPVAADPPPPAAPAVPAVTTPIPSQNVTENAADEAPCSSRDIVNNMTESAQSNAEVSSDPLNPSLILKIAKQIVLIFEKGSGESNTLQRKQPKQPTRRPLPRIRSASFRPNSFEKSLRQMQYKRKLIAKDSKMLAESEGELIGQAAQEGELIQATSELDKHNIADDEPIQETSDLGEQNSVGDEPIQKSSELVEHDILDDKPFQQPIELGDLYISDENLIQKSSELGEDKVGDEPIQNPSESEEMNTSDDEPIPKSSELDELNMTDDELIPKSSELDELNMTDDEPIPKSSELGELNMTYDKPIQVILASQCESGLVTPDNESFQEQSESEESKMDSLPGIEDKPDEKELELDLIKECSDEESCDENLESLDSPTECKWYCVEIGGKTEWRFGKAISAERPLVRHSSSDSDSEASTCDRKECGQPVNEQEENSIIAEDSPLLDEDQKEITLEGSKEVEEPVELPEKQEDPIGQEIEPLEQKPSLVDNEMEKIDLLLLSIEQNLNLLDFCDGAAETQETEMDMTQLYSRLIEEEVDIHSPKPTEALPLMDETDVMQVDLKEKPNNDTTDLPPLKLTHSMEDEKSYPDKSLSLETKLTEGSLIYNLLDQVSQMNQIELIKVQNERNYLSLFEAIPYKDKPNSRPVNPSDSEIGDSSDFTSEMEPHPTTSNSNKTEQFYQDRCHPLQIILVKEQKKIRPLARNMFDHVYRMAKNTPLPDDEPFDLDDIRPITPPLGYEKTWEKITKEPSLCKDAYVSPKTRDVLVQTPQESSEPLFAENSKSAKELKRKRPSEMDHIKIILPKRARLSNNLSLKVVVGGRKTKPSIRRNYQKKSTNYTSVPKPEFKPRLELGKEYSHDVPDMNSSSSSNESTFRKDHSKCIKNLLEMIDLQLCKTPCKIELQAYGKKHEWKNVESDKEFLRSESDKSVPSNLIAWSWTAISGNILLFIYWDKYREVYEELFRNVDYIVFKQFKKLFGETLFQKRIINSSTKSDRRTERRMKRKIEDLQLKIKQAEAPINQESSVGGSSSTLFTSSSELEYSRPKKDAVQMRISQICEKILDAQDQLEGCRQDVACFKKKLDRIRYACDNVPSTGRNEVLNMLLAQEEHLTDPIYPQ